MSSTTLIPACVSLYLFRACCDFPDFPHLQSQLLAFELVERIRHVAEPMSEVVQLLVDAGPIKVVLALAALQPVTGHQRLFLVGVGRCRVVQICERAPSHARRIFDLLLLGR